MSDTGWLVNISLTSPAGSTWSGDVLSVTGATKRRLVELGVDRVMIDFAPGGEEGQVVIDFDPVKLPRDIPSNDLFSNASRVLTVLVGASCVPSTACHDTDMTAQWFEGNAGTTTA